jgi:hypothetical protein
MTIMRRKPTYYSLGSEGQITASKLRRANRKIQRQAMETWFYHKFERPDTLPYESAEGGYQWIWGGPYDPRDELEGEFGGTVREKVIDELADELEEISYEWSGNSNLHVPDDDDYLYRFVPTDFSIHDRLQISFHNIDLLLTLKAPDETLKTHLNRLCFANVITAFETYLADRFAASLKGNTELLQRFVEKNPDFRLEKITISELFKEFKNIEAKVGTYLSQLVWHNLAKVIPMYKATLNVSFPPDMDDVHRAIRDRHDIVHRNGKSTDGKEGSWGEKEVHELMTAITLVVNEIEKQLAKEANASPF